MIIRQEGGENTTWRRIRKWVGWDYIPSHQG